MSFIAEITLYDPILFVSTFEEVPDAECTFEDFHYTTDEEGNVRYVFFWWATGCEFDEYECALRDDPTVDEYRVVTEVADRRLYRVVTERIPEEQPLVYPFFREHDITALESRRTASGLHLRARFPSREVLRAFLEAGEEIADRIEVTRLYTEESTEPKDGVLTRKQREALALAFRHGYFETPSEVTLAGIADEFDVTPQTLSKHIRAGVWKLVENAVGAEAGRDERG